MFTINNLYKSKIDLKISNSIKSKHKPVLKDKDTLSMITDSMLRAILPKFPKIRK